MQRRRLIGTIAPALIGIAGLIVAALGGQGADVLQRQLQAEHFRRLTTIAQALDVQLGRDFTVARKPEYTTLLTGAARTHDVGLALFAADGTTLVDLSAVADAAQAPEVRDALAGRTVETSRIDGTVDKRRRFFTAVPLVRDGRIAAVLQVSESAAAVDEAVASWWSRWAVVAGLAIAAAGGTAAFLAKRIRRSLEKLRQTVDAQADRDGASAVPADVEIAEAAAVGDALVRLADRFGERLEGVLRINSEQEAVLAGMAEGVLAIDAERRVISLNRSAGRLLGVSPAEIMGRALHEIVRNPELLRFVDQLLATRKPYEQDIVFRHADERVLQVRGTLLSDKQGHGFGAVFVLNDVSRLRRLENMRRDFAANVSHELKTPITSIKGFIETILDGATPEDTERFLRIIARQTDRLDAIIDDLLSLSRIEKEAEASDIALSPSRLKEIVLAAAHDCHQKADERGISFEIHCPDEAEARVNSLLLQQAVRNLLENAVKYSDARSAVVVQVERTTEEVRISVIDRGCGIAPEHHARLFERFYRVDKARSRKLGGTGLGLAIVKHIVLAHRGRVTVESALGKGSTFTIHLPPLPPSAGSEPKRKTA